MQESKYNCTKWEGQEENSSKLRESNRRNESGGHGSQVELEIGKGKEINVRETEEKREWA